MIVINPRFVAAEILVNITKDGMYNNMALKKALRQNGAMSDTDKAFVTEVVNGTLRNIFFMDYVINDVSSVKTEKMKPWILAVLRSAVYQIKFMDVPKRAAVDEAVKLVKDKGLGKLAGFTNAVLRNIPEHISFPDEKKEPAEYLEIKYSHPKWLVRMWISQFGYDFVKELCEANGKPADITVIANRLKTDGRRLEQMLESNGVNTKKGTYLTDAVHISRTGDISALKGFKDGLFHIQDESSALAVLALGPKAGENILDICAAPGGKSLFMAELMDNKGSITSRDIYEHKLELIEDSAKRMGINIIKTELKDASVFYEEDKNKFDRVLVDAPCSGFGLMRKKADIRFNRTGNDIDGLVKLQREILSSAGRYVKPGGILVYSTCTICKKENIGNMMWFLESYGFEPVDLTGALPKDVCGSTAVNGFVSLFPNIHGTDGFFISCMRRKG